MSEPYLDPNFICISFLGDTSGSMVNLDTKMLINKINNIIHDQAMNKEVIFYGATFSDKFDLFADGIDGNISLLDTSINENKYIPNGLTALIPSIARMIRIVGYRLSLMTRRPSKVIFILLSDGEQTVNKLINNDIFDNIYEGTNGYENLKKLISEHQYIWKWEFICMGTNFDSINFGKKIGLDKYNCINFHYSNEGLKRVLHILENNLINITNNKKVRFSQEDRTYTNNDIYY
jgi:hypothetical protein